MSVMMTLEDRGRYRFRHDDSPALGELLREARLAARLSEADLAERSGVSERCVRAIERGANTSPRQRTLRALAAALHLPEQGMHELLDARVARGHLPLAPRPLPLPVPVPPLVDRTSEVAQLSRLACSPGVRLISLLGPGGVGKSRLALALATALDRSFRDHAVFVALEDATDLVQVMTRTAQALFAPVDFWEPLHAQLVSALQGRELLLVLDNVEQLPLSTFVVDLLTSCPELRIVTTSRQPLRVRGEYRYEVGPLALPRQRWVPATDDLEQAPATALFLQCARCLPVELPLTEQNRIDIDVVCRLAEGVPLRIEQAASLLTTRSLAEIARQMRDPLACLHSAPADLPDRHQSLAASVRWSYDLLTADEQWLLRLLSEIDEDFTDDVVYFRARGAAGGPATQLGVAQCLRALVEKHLIQQEAQRSSYRLPGHIRAFACGQSALRKQAAALRARG